MGKVLLWLAWAVELLVFVAGAGCVLILFSGGSGGFDSLEIVGVVIVIASVALCGYGVFKAAQTIGRDGSANRIAVYMLLPVAAVFVFSGGCALMLSGL